MKELIKRLTTYKNKIEARLDSEVPEKQKVRTKEFKAFLVKELRDVSSKLEKLKLESK
jgi:hypothetical protein